MHLEAGSNPSQLEGTTWDAGQLRGLHLPEATPVSWKDSLGTPVSWKDFTGTPDQLQSAGRLTLGMPDQLQSAGRLTLGTPEATTVSWKAYTWDLEATTISWKDYTWGRQKQFQSADELHLGRKVRKENVLKEVF